MSQPSLPLTALPCPEWCSPKECDVHGVAAPRIGGAHRSEPVEADFGPLVPQPSRFPGVYLYQAGAPEPGDVFLVFEVADVTVALPVEEGHEFARQLADLTWRAITAIAGGPR
jgi:hypothetical protein